MCTDRGAEAEAPQQQHARLTMTVTIERCSHEARVGVKRPTDRALPTALYRKRPTDSALPIDANGAIAGPQAEGLAAIPHLRAHHAATLSPLVTALAAATLVALSVQHWV